MLDNFYFMKMKTSLVLVFSISLLKLSNQAIPGCENFVNVEDFHSYARNNIVPPALHYYDGFGLFGKTYQDNMNAFNRLRIRPRYMRDVSNRSLETTVLGHKISFPMGISPHAAQCGAHPDGENGTAKAAAEAGILMILSTYSTISMEQVAASAPNGLRWFQLHLFPDRNLTQDMVFRAEKAGYKALVLTVDFPVEGIRYFNDRDHYEYPEGASYANFDVYVNRLHRNIRLQEASDPDPNTTWKDLTWLKSITYLPIVLKGILTAEDAKLAVRYGASGILVSNHGGRQLDGVPATIDALPEIIDAVQSEIEVYLDSGVRTGSDVFKALSLGARAVFYGRPNVWGLSYLGSKGSKCVMDIYKRELDITMALAGYKSVNLLSQNALVKDGFYQIQRW